MTERREIGQVSENFFPSGSGVLKGKNVLAVNKTPINLKMTSINHFLGWQSNYRPALAANKFLINLGDD
jgi:hypothetical protein